MAQIRAVLGTRDILPVEVTYWQWVETTARDILTRAAYREIRTPIFEQVDLFASANSENTETNSLSLRSEGKLGVVRALIEHNLYIQDSVQRLWYNGPMFRKKTPQIAMQEQFYQLGLEIFGCLEPRADAEAIALAWEIFQELGLKNLRLEINSIGQPEEQRLYALALTDYFKPYFDGLDFHSQQLFHTNPLLILDSKHPRTQEICQTVPNISSYFGLYSERHFEQLRQLLTNLAIPYHINPLLVRGLNYHTQTTFEILSDDLGTNTMICGGGRYDRLVQKLGGPKVPAFGWATDLSQLILLLQSQFPHSQPQLDFYVTSRGNLAEPQALVIAQKLRQAGFSVELDLSGIGFRRQFIQAEQSGAVACLILGDEQAHSSTVKLKWIPTKEQQIIPQSELIAQVDSLRQRVAVFHAEKINIEQKYNI